MRSVSRLFICTSIVLKFVRWKVVVILICEFTFCLRSTVIFGRALVVIYGVVIFSLISNDSFIFRFGSASLDFV